MDTMNHIDRQLRREAERTRPAFSEALHARFRQAILESPRPASARRGRRLVLAMSAVAAAAMATGLLFWQGTRRPPAQQHGTDASGMPDVSVTVPPSTAGQWLGAADLLDEGDRLSKKLLVMASSDTPWSPATEEAQAAILSRVPISQTLLEELIFEPPEMSGAAESCSSSNAGGGL